MQAERNRTALEVRAQGARADAPAERCFSALAGRRCARGKVLSPSAEKSAVDPDRRATPVMRFERAADGIWHGAAETSEGIVNADGITLTEARLVLEQLLQRLNPAGLDRE